MMAAAAVYVAVQQFCETDDRPRQPLPEAGFELRHNNLGRRLRRAEMTELLRGADAVIAGVEPYDEALFAALPRLRCISRIGVGTDAIDLAAAQRREIAILTSGEEVVEPVAQMTVAMMLALARNLPLHLHDVRAGEWKKRTGVLLSEWTIGLLGFGRIGRAVAHGLRAFGPRIVVTDPCLTAEGVPSGVQAVGLERLLAESDLVSVHASRPAAEGALIGERELGLMKPGSYFVNTARGYFVDESALAAALRNGRLAGAALDVFGEEPYRGPLAAMPQVLCTPHVSTLTRASRAAMELRAAENVISFFRQHHLANYAAVRSEV